VVDLELDVVALLVGLASFTLGPVAFFIMFDVVRSLWSVGDPPVEILREDYE